MSSDYRAPRTPAAAAAVSSLLSSFPLSADLTLLAFTSFEKKKKATACSLSHNCALIVFNVHAAISIMRL